MDKNQVTIDISADIGELKRGMAEAKASIESLSQTLKQPSAALDEASKKSDRAAVSFSRMGITVGALVTTMLLFAKNTLNAADALGDMHLRTGVSVKDLASLSLIAEQSGTSLDSVARGMQRLSVTIGQGEQGNKQYTESLIRLGVTSKDPKEALFQLADAVKASNDPTKLAGDLQRVLGMRYSELLPLLKEGGDGLRKSAQETDKYADAMERLAPEADRLNDELARMKTEAAGAAAQIMTKLVPSLADTAERVRELMDEGHGIQALVRAMAGLGKLPFDALFGDIKIASTAKDRIAELRMEIGQLERDKASGNGKLMQMIFGTPAEIDQKIAVLKNQVAALEKFGDKVYTPKPTPTTPSGASIDLGSGTKTRSIDKDAMWATDVAAAIKGANAELEIYAGNLAFIEQGDMNRSNAINAISQEWKDAGRALQDEMMTPLENFEQRLDYINTLWEKGVIDIETYDRAMADAFDKTGQKGKDAFADLKQAVEGWGKDASNAFADWAMGAETSIGDVGKAWVREMIQMAAYESTFKPLASAASGAMSSMFSAIFSAQGNAFEGPSGMSAYRNSVVNRPTVVALAKGAAVIGEKPGSPGEGVFPLTRMGNGDLGVSAAGAGGGTMIVNIIESPGNGGKTEQRQDNGGANILDVYVEQIKGSIAGDISSGRGAIPGALAGTYGLNRVAGAF